MSRRPALFRQMDVTNPIRGALKAGLPVRRVEIDAAGKIVVICAEEAPKQLEMADGWEARLRRARGWEK
jgi:hypothetical protein